MTDTALGVPGSGQPLSQRQIKLVFFGLMLGMLLAALDQTAVATALPTIAGELGGVGHLSWVVTAYLLTSTASTPLYGKLSDLYGRKLLFQIAIVIFLIGSILSGLSQDMLQLILFRALQGLGGGGLLALAMAIAGDMVSPRERGRYQGYFGGVFTVSSVAGPLIGGLFTEHLSWRWIFYINIPLGIVALVVTSSVLRLAFHRRQASVDYMGATLLVGGVVALLLVTVWGGTIYRWGSPTVILTTALGIVLLVAFVVWEDRFATEPILPLWLFKRRLFSVANAMAFLLGAIMFGALIYMQEYFQLVKSYSPTVSGLLMLPMMMTLLVASVAGGRLVTHYGRYKLLVVIGSISMVFGMWLLSHLGLHSPTWEICLYTIPVGLGMGFVMQNLVLAVQNDADAADMGTATGAVNFFRSLGASFGVAMFGAVLTARLDYWIPLFVPGAAGRHLGASIVTTPGAVHHLPPAVQAGVFQSFVRSVHVVFLVGVPVATACLLLSFFLPELPLRRHSHIGSELGVELVEGSPAGLVINELLLDDDEELVGADGVRATDPGPAGAPGDAA
jgi:EmrB/QacA subfamily drug resistance transporter